MKKILFIFGITIGISFLTTATPARATGDNYTLSGTTSTYAQNGVTLEITDVQITQIAGDASSTVPVKLLVTNGSLSLATTTGLTFTGPSTGATLQFEGTLSAVNAALATISYTRASTGNDTLEISLVDPGEVFFEENGHLYEYVSATLTWGQAKTAAEGRTKYGSTGYLTTITSGAENSFVAARLDDAGWMGASDSAIEGQWRWVTGPENGTQFWQGVANGNTVNDEYANWNTGEPNEHGAGEDCGQFLAGSSGLWNDLPCTVTTLPGYVVEYGATGDLPSVASRNISITTINAPTVSTLSPADNATNIATNSNLVLTFDTPVSVATGTIDIRKSSDNSLVTSIPVTSAQVTGSNTTTITINPTSDLASETSYYILVSSTAFAAYTSTTIYYAGISNATTWNFTTADETPPTVSSFSPTDDSETLATDANISVTFDDDIATGTGYIYLKLASDDSTVEAFNVASSTVSISGSTTLVLNPTSDLDDQTAYYITIDATAVDDTSGNSFAGISTATTWNFTTRDETAPTVSSLTPADNTTDISRTPTLTMVFDEAVDIETGNIVIYKASDDSSIETISVASGAITKTSATTVAISLSTRLAYSTAYYVLVDATVIDDTSSNSFAGISGNTVWNFTTLAAPVVGGGGFSTTPPQAQQFSGSAVINGENGILPLLRDTKLESNADETLVTRMSLSLDDPTFATSPLIAYSPVYDIDLPTDGKEHILYVRYYSHTGERSKDFQIIIPATTNRPIETTQPSLVCSIDFSQITTPIKYGAANNSDHVRLLEQFLNTYAGATLTVDGIYGEEDLGAVIAWQEAHAADILAPWGITTGTGYVSTTSIKKIKQIHAAACTTQITEETNTPAPEQVTPTNSTFTTPLAFSRSLERGMRGADIRLLQQVLNHLGFTVDTTGVGSPGQESDYFGQLTYDAVLRFQAAYASQILAPLGLTAPTGFVGPSTIAQLRALVE